METTDNNVDVNVQRGAGIPIPLNYFWNPTDPALPFSTSGPGNPTLFPPANATRTPVPTSYPKGSWPCWDYENQKWILKADFRQVRLWDKTTGQEVYSSTIDCPPNTIDVEPPSDFCKWDENKKDWVLDQEAADASEVERRKKLKTSELTVAGSQIEQIQEILMVLEDDTDEVDDYNSYSVLLKQWQKYRAKLNLLNPNNLKSAFPVRPSLIGE